MPSEIKFFEGISNKVVVVYQKRGYVVATIVMMGLFIINL